MNFGEVRTVYAVLPDGTQIVRYDRSKRWFHETADGRRIKRFRRVNDATRLVRQSGGTVFYGRPYGSYFDRYMVNDLPPIRRYTEAGLRQAIAREQAKYARALAKWEYEDHRFERQWSYYLKYYNEGWLRERMGLVRPVRPTMDPFLKRKAG